MCGTSSKWNSRVTRTARVQGVDGDEVLVLLEHNDLKETVSCSIDKKYWGDRPVSLHQEIQVSWNPEKLDEPLQVEFVETAPSVPRLIRYTHEVLGLNPGDKLLIVIGPNRRAPHQIIYELIKEHYPGGDSNCGVQKAVRELALKSAGWGELMGLTRFLVVLYTLGIPPSNIEFKLCESTSVNFNPDKYHDRHIIFIGSIKSNEILEKYYWDKLNLQNKYYFEDASLTVQWNESNGTAENRLMYETKEEIPFDALDHPDKVKIKDHFLLAKVFNPYSRNGTERHCLLFSGTGTIGTGYAGLTAGGQQSIKKMYSWYENQSFELIGRIDMQGMFNPLQDPVRCVFDGKQEMDDEILLPNAMMSPQVSDLKEHYTKEDFEQDLRADPEYA